MVINEFKEVFPSLFRRYNIEESFLCIDVIDFFMDESFHEFFNFIESHFWDGAISISVSGEFSFQFIEFFESLIEIDIQKKSFHFIEVKISFIIRLRKGIHQTMIAKEQRNFCNWVRRLHSDLKVEPRIAKAQRLLQGSSEKERRGEEKERRFRKSGYYALAPSPLPWGLGSGCDHPSCYPSTATTCGRFLGCTPYRAYGSATLRSAPPLFTARLLIAGRSLRSLTSLGLHAGSLSACRVGPSGHL